MKILCNHFGTMYTVFLKALRLHGAKKKLSKRIKITLFLSSESKYGSVDLFKYKEDLRLFCVYNTHVKKIPLKLFSVSISFISLLVQTLHFVRMEI